MNDTGKKGFITLTPGGQYFHPEGSPAPQPDSRGRVTDQEQVQKGQQGRVRGAEAEIWVPVPEQNPDRGTLQHAGKGKSTQPSQNAAGGHAVLPGRAQQAGLPASGSDRTTSYRVRAALSEE